VLQLQTMARFAVQRCAGLCLWIQAARCRFGHTSLSTVIFSPFLQMISMVTLGYFSTVQLEHNYCFAHPFWKSCHAGVPLNIPNIIFFGGLRKHFLCMLLLKKKGGRKHLMIVKE